MKRELPSSLLEGRGEENPLGGKREEGTSLGGKRKEGASRGKREEGTNFPLPSQKEEGREDLPLRGKREGRGNFLLHS